MSILIATSQRRLLVAALVCAGCARGRGGAPAPPPVPTAPVDSAVASASDLVRRMHDRWAGKWYRTLRFRQHNTLFRNDGGEVRSEWMEYQSVPRRLRIDFLPADTKSGILFVDDSVYTFDAGRRTHAERQVHPLLLLSADVYAIAPESTLAALDSIGIDAAVLRRDTLDGRPAYVVGATAGDTTADQFWVDADRLLLTRLVHRQSTGSRTTVTDYRFTYQDVDGYPVPKEISFLRGGRPYWREEYAEVAVNPPLAAELFDPAHWATAQPPAH